MPAHKLCEYSLSFKFADVSTAESQYLVVPFSGHVKSVYTALEGAITGADVDVVVTANGVACGTIVIANTSSAAGDIDSISCDVPIVAGQSMLFALDGTSTGAQSLGVTVVIDRAV